jgi:hypothetical protein
MSTHDDVLTEIEINDWEGRLIYKLRECEDLAEEMRGTVNDRSLDNILKHIGLTSRKAKHAALYLKQKLQPNNEG